MLFRTTLIIATLATAACQRDRARDHQEPLTTKPAATKPVEPSPIKRLDGEDLAAKYRDCITFINTVELEAYRKECVAESFVGHHVGGVDVRGPDAMIGTYKSMQRAFTDFQLQPQLIAVSGRNVVAIHLLTGTHDGDLAMYGVPAIPKTGKKIGILFFHRLAIDDENKATEEWTYSDPLTMLGQLGHLPNGAEPMRPALAQSWSGAPIIAVTGDTEDERANLDLFAKAIAPFNSHDVDAMIRFYAEDAIESDQVMGVDHRGQPAIAKATSDFIQAFPDVKAELTHLYAAGHYIIAEGRITGTNTGTVGTVKATDKPIDAHFAEIVKIKDGKIVELYRFMNGLAFHNQLGPATPSTPPTTPAPRTPQHTPPTTPAS